MYPTQEAMFIPLLSALAKRGGEIWFSTQGAEIEEELADHFSLTQEERRATSPNINAKGRRVWRNHIQYARAKLVRDGYVDNSIRDL
jgi:hypothetical protein